MRNQILVHQIRGFKYADSNMRIQIVYNGDPFENFGHNPNTGRSSSSVSLLSPRVNFFPNYRDFYRCVSEKMLCNVAKFHTFPGISEL